MNYDKNELRHYGVLGMKWGIRRARRYAEKSAKAKALGDNDTAKKYRDKSKKIQTYHEEMAGKKTLERVSNRTVGKLAIQSLLMGTYGSLKYHQSKAGGLSTGRAAVNGVLFNIVNIAEAGYLGIVEPRTHRGQHI